MSRFYRCAFVGLVSLLAVILLSFFLLFTDVGFSPSAWTNADLESGNIWAAKKLRVSAELAYYWTKDTEKLSSLQEKGVDHLNIDDRGVARNDHNISSKHESDDHWTVTPSSYAKIFMSDASSEKEKGDDGLSIDNNVEQITSNKDKNYGEISGNKHGITEQDKNTVLTNSSRQALAYLSNTTPTQIQGTRDTTTSATTTASFAHTEPTANSSLNLFPTAEQTAVKEKEAATQNEDLLDADGDDFNEVENLYDEENSVEEQKNIQLAFTNEVKLIDIGNLSQNHSKGYIQPELIERASNVEFNMPCPTVYKSVPELVMAPWMKPLLSVLSSFKGRQVTLVIANNAYRDVLLNWLISAKIVSRPPIENILVVSLEGNLYRLLQSRDIPSILASVSTVLNTKHRFRRFFELIMMMRLAFMRLINRLGYDCAMYDIDAIILKNPQPLYDKWGDKDIVGSWGELPRQLWRRWGVTICIGAVFIRSNTRTELYWESVHAARLNRGLMANDQIRLNYGLHHLHVEWEQDKQVHRQHQQNQPALGHSPNSGLSVVVLPLNDVCRFDCQPQYRSRYYVWHKGGSRDKKSKMKGAKQGRTWFLNERWSEIHANMVVDVRGNKWLKRISNNA